MTARRMVVSLGDGMRQRAHCITLLVALRLKAKRFPVALAPPMELCPMFDRLVSPTRRIFSVGVDVTLSCIALLSIKSTLTYIRDHDHAPRSDMFILILYILMTYFITRSMFYDIVYKRYSAYYAFFMVAEPEIILGDTVFGSPISQFTNCVYDPIQHAPSIGAGPLAGERIAAEEHQTLY